MKISSSLSESVGQQIRRARVAVGMRQGALARLIGMQQSRLSMAEHDLVELRVDELELIERILRKAAQERVTGLQVLFREEV